jgi:hypothetical protein
VISLVSSDQESAARKLQKRLGLDAAFTDPPAEGTLPAVAGTAARSRQRAVPSLAGRDGRNRDGGNRAATSTPADLSGRRRRRAGRRFAPSGTAAPGQRRRAQQSA